VGQRALASGALEKVDTIPYGHTTWHYRLDRPVPITRLAVAVGPYVTAVARAASCEGCAAVEVWSYSGDSAAAAGAFRRAGDIADYLTRLLGPYPYGRLVHAEAAIPIDAAGSAGMVLYRESLYGGGPSEALVARETARQWFGLAVSADSADDRRLLEGLPLYLAALWQDQAGPAGRKLAETMRDAADSALAATGGDAWRGAWTLHELRGVMGDSAFTRGLAAIYREHRDGAVAAAAVARAMSQAAGRDVEWVLRQDSGEVPELEARVVRRGGGYALSLRASGPGELRMPGLRLLVDGRPVRVDLAGRETTVRLRGFTRAPARIELDPSGTWLVRLRRAA
jgi:aminopeptidase N